MSRKAIPLFLAMLCLVAAACGGSKGEGVVVYWQARDPEFNEDGPVPTVVRLRNDTGETIRDARLRFNATEARGGHAGLSIGTITNASSRFEGDAQVWSLGDLPPHTELAFEIGLWFDSELQVLDAPPVSLAVELASSDLRQAVSSNRLVVPIP
jgi:hypothetical protein